MLGSFRRRGCTCKKKRCTCGSKWHYRYDVTDPITGRRKQKETRGFDSKPEVEEEAKRIMAELQQGTYIEQQDITFRDFAKKWIGMYASSGKVKPSTVDIRESKLQILLRYFGNIKLKDITKIMYQDMLDDLAHNKYARKTIASVHETGSFIFQKGIELDIILKDSTLYATIPTIKKTVEELEEETEIPKYLEKEELAHFLRVAKDKGMNQDFYMFLLLAYTGMRSGELCVLKWRDIDFENQVVSINKTLYNKKKDELPYQIGTPKSKKSKRKIDVDVFVLEELEKHRAKQNLVRMEKRNVYHDKDFIFTQERNLGFPNKQQQIHERMVRLLKLSGLDQNLSPHSLRHTHTSLLAEAGVDLEVIMQRLGHQSDTVTRLVYLHVTKSKKKEASQKFAELMRSF